MLQTPPLLGVAMLRDWTASLIQTPPPWAVTSTGHLILGRAKRGAPCDRIKWRWARRCGASLSESREESSSPISPRSPHASAKAVLIVVIDSRSPGLFDFPRPLLSSPLWLGSL